MAISHELRLQVTRPGRTPDSQTITITGGHEIGIEEAIANAETDLEITFSVDKSALQYVWIHSDQDITIETNDGAAPDDTITLKANKPEIWYADCPHTSPFDSADVTSIFVTNSSGSTANLEIYGIVDPTP